MSTGVEIEVILLSRRCETVEMLQLYCKYGDIGEMTAEQSALV